MRQLSPWVPRRRYSYGKVGTVYESDNKEIWLSWGRHMIAFHLSVGEWSLMRTRGRKGCRTGGAADRRPENSVKPAFTRQYEKE